MLSFIIKKKVFKALVFNQKQVRQLANITMFDFNPFEPSNSPKFMIF